MKLFQMAKAILLLIKNPGKVPKMVRILAAEISKHGPPINTLPPDKIEMSAFSRTTIFPVPVVLCGAMIDGRPNFNLLGNFGIICPERPNPTIYISSARKHFTNKGIREHGFFSINIPSPSVMDRADYCGSASGNTIDKSKVFTAFFGRKHDVPFIAECPINYYCRVINSLVIKTMDVFIAEIVRTFISKKCTDSGRIIIERVEPLIYTGDGKYRTPGLPVGNAYREYRKYTNPAECGKTIPTQADCA